MQPSCNRRVGRRRKAKQSTKVICLKGCLGLGRNIALSVLDVSEAGACLIVKELLTPGQDVDLTFESEAVPRPVTRIGRVVWCLARQDGDYCIGVRFENFLPYMSWQSMTMSE